MQPIQTKDLMTNGLKICENCEWCIPTEYLSKCLLKNADVGLFEYCNKFKRKNGEHYTA